MGSVRPIWFGPYPGGPSMRMVLNFLFIIWGGLGYL